MPVSVQANLQGSPAVEATYEWRSASREKETVKGGEHVYSAERQHGHSAHAPETYAHVHDGKRSYGPGATDSGYPVDKTTKIAHGPNTGVSRIPDPECRVRGPETGNQNVPETGSYYVPDIRKAETARMAELEREFMQHELRRRQIYDRKMQEVEALESKLKGALFEVCT